MEAEEEVRKCRRECLLRIAAEGGDVGYEKKNDDHDDEKKEMNGSWVAKRGQKCCCCCFKGLLYISVTNLVARKIHRKNDDVNRVNTSSSGCSIHFLVLIS